MAQEGKNSGGQREQWGSKIGFLLAAIGSAVGLGNIWRFPYMTGIYGGAAFILIYLLCIGIIGIPVMLSEFVIGRRTQKDAIGAFQNLAPGTPWFLTGTMGVVAAFTILSFYGVVAGWSIAYTVKSITGELFAVSVADLPLLFDNLIADPVEPIVWQGIFMFLTVAIVLGGVKSGIERWSKLMMPALAFLLVILVLRSLTLPGAGGGVAFLFRPDFSKLTGTAILAAMGHAFFSLSLGMGAMITYGSYVHKDDHLPSATLNVALYDTIFALLAGLAIFPAVFNFGLQPDEGPGLLFVTLPSVFAAMPAGRIFAILFFALVAMAALTSSISMIEVVVAYTVGQLGWSRRFATIFLGFVIFLIGVPASLSMGPALGEFQIWGRSVFGFLDHLSSDILLPLGGLFIVLFVGWYWGTKSAMDEATNGGRVSFSWGSLWVFVLRFVTPVAIGFVFLNVTNLLTFFANLWGGGQ